MKKLLLLIPMALIMNSCSQVDGANPSQNKTVNIFAGTKAKKPGYMQRALDNWLKTEWEPTVSGTKPTADTKVKVVEKEDGTAKLVEVKTGVVLKELSKEEVKKQKEVQEKYQDEDRHFTLQEYVDKLSVYNSNHMTSEEDSHYHKMKSMPVIGNSKR